MRLFHSAILLLITLFSASSLCAASELDDRQKIINVVQDAFAHDRFSDITDLADRYRVGKSRTGSGTWKLTMVYVGIDQAIRSETQGRDRAPAFQAVMEKMQRWTKLQPNSPAAHLGYAHAHQSYAWAIRGGGYASKVRPEAWVPFHAEVEETRLYLEKTKAIAAVDPHWYEMMLNVARLQSWDAKRFGTTFDAAVKREPLFYQHYFVAVDYFLPKWQGNVKDVELFAQFAAKKTAATDGTGMYARIYWYASQSDFGDAIFQDSLANWPKMKAGFDDVLARYPDDWNYNTYGKFACLAKDKKSTREFFIKIGDQPMYEAWTSPAMIDACRAWAQSGAI